MNRSLLSHASPRYSPALLLVFVWVFAFGSSPAYAQDTGRFLRWAGEDASLLARKATSKTGLYALGGLAVITPMSMLDQSISHRLDRPSGGFASEYLDLANELGGPRMTFVSAGLFGVSLLTDDERFQDAAFTSFESLVYSGVITYGLKTVAGRFRPEDGLGPYELDPFSGNTSFPSGHTNAAFAVLTPWALYYPSPLTKGLLVVGAGGTALARITRDKHWPTDVLAGGAIGFFTAYWLTKQHQSQSASPEAVKARISLLPGAGPAPVMVALTVDF